MDKKDEKLANESVKESTPVKPGEEGNLSEEHSMTTALPHGLATRTPGVPIAGFQDLPVSMLALPSCIVVQGLTDVYLADGKTPAPKGQWWFGDSREVKEEIHFVSLRAVVREKMVEDDKGGMQKRTKLYCLCANADEAWDLFVLILPVTSFMNWGRMMAQMKKEGVKNSYENITTGRIKQMTNPRGQKYFVADFLLGEKLNKEDLDSMAAKYGEYGAVLDRRDIVEGEELDG